MGRNSLHYGNPWDFGGPITFLSEWWVRAHWGRAFEILDFQPHEGGEKPWGQGAVLMRKKPGDISREELERPESDEPREIAALEHQRSQLRDEDFRLRGVMQQVEERSAAEIDTIEDRSAQLAELEGSRSWRMTAPLRAAAHWASRFRR